MCTKCMQEPELEAVVSCLVWVLGIKLGSLEEHVDCLINVLNLSSPQVFIS